MDTKVHGLLKKLYEELLQTKEEVSAGIADNKRQSAEDLNALSGAVHELTELTGEICKEQKALTEQLAALHRALATNSRYSPAKEFLITAEEKEKVVLPEGKIGVNEFAHCINAVIDLNKSRRLTGVELNKQLKKMGILSEIELEDGKKRTTINEQSKDYGIETERRNFNGVDYEKVVFNDQGKKFLLENLEKIMSFTAQN